MTEQHQKVSINEPRRTQTVSANATIDSDISMTIVNTVGAGGAITVTLHDARISDGGMTIIKAPVATPGSGGQNVIVAATGAQTIDGVATVTLAVDQTAITVKSDNANWRIISLTDANAGGEIIFGDLFLDAASPTLTIGNGTGSPTLALNKSDAGTATFDMNVVGVTRWDLLFDALEDVSLERRDGAGVLLDVPILFSQADGTVSILNSILQGGAALTDGVVDATDLIIGDGSGNTGITLFGDGAAGFCKLSATDTAGTEVGSIRYNLSANNWSFATNAGNIRMQINSAGIRPSSSGADDIGATGARWGLGFIDTIFIAGAEAADAVAGAADLVIGDGVDTNDYGATIFVGSLAGDIGRIDITAAAATADGWWSYQPNTNMHEWGASGGAEMQLNTGRLQPASSGGSSLGGSARRWADGFINTLYLAGAALGDADVTADDLVIGDGTAVARGMTFFGTTTSNMSIAFTDGTLPLRAEIRLENSATPDRWVFRSANVDRMALDTTFISPTTDGALGVGDVTSSGWNSLALTERADHVGAATATRGEVWLLNTATQSLMFTDDAGGDWQIGGDTQTANALLLAGAVAADAAAAADDLIIGDGAAEFGITFNIGANTGRVAWNDGTNDEDASVSYNGTTMTFRVTNVNEMTLAAAALSPSSDGGLILGGGTRGWGALWFDEKASQGTPAADHGELWVLNTAPNIQMFTSDDGVDHPLSLAVEPSAANITVANKRVIVTDAGVANVNVNLPAAAEGLDYDIIVLDVGTNTTTVVRGAGDTINGAGANPVLAAVGRYYITALDATDWRLHGPMAEA